MKDLMEDLKARKKLMEETPPEEVKYWFEYTGPLKVRSTRFNFVIGHFTICFSRCPIERQDARGMGTGGLKKP